MLRVACFVLHVSCFVLRVACCVFRTLRFIANEDDGFRPANFFALAAVDTFGGVERQNGLPAIFQHFQGARRADLGAEAA